MKNKNEGIVYSTNPNYKTPETETETQSLKASQQLLLLHRETKGRGGKAVAIVKGFVGPQSELEALAKQLKNHCGVGGSSKDGEILIQGDVRAKVAQFLSAKGYRIKLVGG